MATPRQRSSWFITLPIAAGAIGFLWLVFIPTAKAIRKTREEITAKQLEIVQSQTLEHSLAEAQRDLDLMEKFVKRSEAETPVIWQMASTFGRVTEIARRSGMTTTQFEPQKQTQFELIGQAPVRMVVSGSFHDFRRLLADLEQLPGPVWIDQMKVERDRKDGQSVQAELVFGIFAGNFEKTN